MNKFILKSKTVIGALIALLPAISVLTGVTFTEDDTVMINQTADAIIQVMGGAFAIYGRVVSKGKVYV
jgi:hypothetical protein